MVYLYATAVAMGGVTRGGAREGRHRGQGGHGGHGAARGLERLPYSGLPRAAAAGIS